MKKKSILSLSIILVAALLLVACGGGGTATPDPAPAPEPAPTTDAPAPAEPPESADEATGSFFGTGTQIPFVMPAQVKKVGFSIEQLQTDFAAAQAKAVEEAAKARGWEIEVVQADNDNNKQVQQCEDLIAKGVDMLFLKPLDESSFAPISKECEELGLNLWITSTYLNSPYTACAMADQYQIGVLTATILIENNPSDVKRVFIMRGPLGMETFTLRAQGQKDTLEAAGYTVVYETDANNVQADGLTVTEDFISTGVEFDSIICGADGQAMGAAIAVKEAGLADKVFVMGNGGMREAAENLMQGDLLDATIYLPPSLYIDLIMSVVDKALKGEAFDHQNFVQPKKMMKDNVKDFFPDL